MTPVAMFLVTVAGTFLLGAFGEAVCKRTNGPDVVWLIIAGLVIGPATELVIRAQLLSIAPYFTALTLLIVLFEGLAELSTAAPRSGLLASLSFQLSASTTAKTPSPSGLAAIFPLPLTVVDVPFTRGT